MTILRIKSARHIFKQIKMAGSIPKSIPFNEVTVDVSDIQDDGRYYSKFSLKPSVAVQFGTTARITTVCYASHFYGVESQSYEILFELVGYDTNNNFYRWYSLIASGLNLKKCGQSFLLFYCKCINTQL